MPGIANPDCRDACIAPEWDLDSPIMATVSVRKFLLSIDQHELVDFAQSLDDIGSQLAKLGMSHVGTYSWRFSDPECVIKTELSRSPDGFFISVFVQAMDRHEYRAKELAEAFNAHLLDGTKRPNAT